MPYQLLLINLFFILCIQAAPDQASKPYFIQSWGKNFGIKTTESGEILTVTSIASDSTYLYVNDLSERSIVKIDADGNIISKIVLETIGRSNYTGDDFIIRDNQAVFLNTVDSRLEFFNCQNGAHLKSISFSRDILGETKRSRRIINRIYLDGSSILIGNSHKLVIFQEEALLKQKKVLKAMQFPDNRQVIFYNRYNSIHKSSGKALFSGRTLPIRKSMHSFSGKNMVLLNGIPVQCIISTTGIEIYRE